jgi:hypothetical protein
MLNIAIVPVMLIHFGLSRRGMKIAVVLLAVFSPVLLGQIDGGYKPAIPKVWDDAVMKDLELPLSRPQYSPNHVSETFYYQIPVRPIYKSYPVYHPDREPKGYIDWLRTQEPEVLWDATKLKTREDWIRAGEIVFDSPISYGSLMSRADRLKGADRLYVRDKAFYAAVQPPLTADGVLPVYRYVIRTKGRIDVGMLSCGMCHTRVMADRAVVKGAQGNFPFDRAIAYHAREGGNLAIELNRKLARLLWFTPGLTPEFFANFDRKGPEDIARALETHPGGVLTRHRSGPWAPIQVPDLIGVAARKYLDRTGLQQNRGPEDLMRYAALNQGGDDLSSFGGFVPASEVAGPTLDPKDTQRYSDEQLFALVQFLTSLQPPRNPNPFDRLAAAGKSVFDREGCAQCHTPPLYSNNKLTPAVGFKVPPEHRTNYDILNVVVGTDPALTMQTRRGTGYYKVPSLRGVWYREYFGHDGASKTLEDWLDPARLQTVKGHEFGLKLSQRDRNALIAFLKTL